MRYLGTSTGYRKNFFMRIAYPIWLGWHARWKSPKPMERNPNSASNCRKHNVPSFPMHNKWNRGRPLQPACFYRRLNQSMRLCCLPAKRKRKSNRIASFIRKNKASKNHTRTKTRINCNVIGNKSAWICKRRYKNQVQPVYLVRFKMRVKLDYVEQNLTFIYSKSHLIYSQCVECGKTLRHIKGECSRFAISRSYSWKYLNALVQWSQMAKRTRRKLAASSSIFSTCLGWISRSINT